MESAWWVEVQLDAQLERGPFQVLAGKIRPSVTDGFFGQAAAGPLALNAGIAILQISLRQDRVPQGLHDYGIGRRLEPEAEPDAQSAIGDGAAFTGGNLTGLGGGTPAPPPG